MAEGREPDRSGQDRTQRALEWAGRFGLVSEAVSDDVAAGLGDGYRYGDAIGGACAAVRQSVG